MSLEFTEFLIIEIVIWLIYNQTSSWERNNERTESTSPNASKNFLLPSVNLFSISLRRYLRAFAADSPGTDSANIVEAYEASTESFKTSSSISSTTANVSLAFGVAYKSESVPRACRVSSSSKLVLRTLYNLKETGFRGCETPFLSPLMLNWDIEDEPGVEGRSRAAIPSH
jgi:hypothetical protein